MQKSLRLSAKEAVGGDNKQREVMMLLEAGLKILVLFLAFVGFQDFHRVFESPGLGVCIGDADINDAIGSIPPETSNQDIASLLTLGLAKIAAD